ncbi:aldehyde dehydrogenase [Ktedonobacter sp. SOSP1-52]|uniref:xanthine dehydrogenase family protein molybdopterin-binding subunit n=1 Tax=Ktedonobacter sp. SOSP1-52 TaxID=2778366 RepID=UPI00191513DB|nr:xanthine dehydrogenase family protein molybdopterin-binding subunit [Ktedonobacter sp. SOSP1-52]GHO69866.1 aldehyde dehydrogenase [Ktedonobacter sp. SOSP1-52]
MGKQDVLAADGRRREDVALITGRAHYVDDIRLPEGRPAPLHMAVVRSIYAHAKLGRIDVEAARALLGVVGAFTGEELVRDMPILEPAPMPGLKKPQRRPMALQRVRYVGDPVAVALAESPALVADARDLVDISYEPLPAVSDPEAALAPGAPLLYEEFGSNIAVQTHASGGDIEAAFAQAEHTTRFRVVNQRIAPSSLEPRGCLFDFDPATGELTAWLSSQSIYRARDTLAHFLHIAREKIHVYNAEVGGGFGSKAGFVGEELVAAALAVRYGRPVKWIESRSENLQAQTQGRGQINYIEAAFQGDGRLLGLRVRTVADLGAFLSAITAMVPHGTAYLLSGPYRVQAIDVQMVGVYTNKVATAPYRGAGRPEAAYILERTLDRIAHILKLDPAEVRQRNFIDANDFPHRTVMGMSYESGNYQAGLERLLTLADYTGWRTKQREQRSQGESKYLLGIGLATFIENSGGSMGPIRPGIPQEAATVRIRSDGTILVQSGVASNGQGHFTAFAQIVAKELNVSMSHVEVQMNDASLPAFGIGTFGSRTTQTSGSAVLLAAQAVRGKALQVAARTLEVSPQDLVLEDGQVMVQGVPARVLSLGELARMVEAQPELIEHEAPNPVNGVSIEGLAAWRDFVSPESTFSSGAHMAVVEIDTETGEVKLEAYVAVDDCGRVLNEFLAEAQVHGGVAQGIGQALYEETLYDQEGQFLTSTFMDYAMPFARGIPEIQAAFVETPSPRNPLGVKGVGEGGTIGAPPAVVNAVLDALEPLGIQNIDMPIKPERVWALIQSARQGALQEIDPVLPSVFQAEVKASNEAPEFG